MKKLFVIASITIGTFVFSINTASAQTGEQSSTPAPAENNQQRTSSNTKETTAKPQGSQISTSTPAPSPANSSTQSNGTGQQATTPPPAQDNSGRAKGE